MTRTSRQEAVKNDEDRQVDEDLDNDTDEDVESAAVESAEAPAEDAAGSESATDDEARDGKSASADKAGRIRWTRVFAYGVVPALALLLALGAGYAKWFGATQHVDPTAAAESVEVATNGAIAMLSYQPDTAEEDLVSASDMLTGEFKDAYTMLVTDVVVPGAREQQISAVASVPAAASVAVSDNHAVALVFVNQTTTVGNNPPTDLASTVRVNLEKVDDRWLISQFEPI